MTALEMYFSYSYALILSDELCAIFQWWGKLLAFLKYAFCYGSIGGGTFCSDRNNYGPGQSEFSAT